MATSAAEGPASYTVAAANSIGAGAVSPPKTVTWTAPPAGGADFCSSYANVTEIRLPWGVGRLDVTQYGGFAGNGVIVGRFDVPASYTGGLGNIRFFEWVPNIAGNMRNMNISRSKCDFRGFNVGSASATDPTGANYPMQWSNDLQPSLFFGATTATRLVAGQTYYVNVRNVDWSTGQLSCTLSNCGGAFSITAP